MGHTLTGNATQSGLFVREDEEPEHRAGDIYRFEFDDGSFVRPWLFGNWWKQDSAGSSLQLMGLGVRLAATPNVEDAEGNNTETHFPDGRTLTGAYYPNGRTMRNIYWHGSYLRIRMQDGMPPLLISHLHILNRQQRVHWGV
jgi:hypothetical protein